MKSCIFHKKYLLAGIYIIFVLFTCCNSRFYHTPLAKICSVTEKQTLSREGTRGSKEYYYTQNITARILNGSHKGEKITVSNEYTSSQVQTKKYHKGDTVLLSGSKESPGKTIRSVKGWVSGLIGRRIIFSPDLHYRKAGILHDNITDTEYGHICVWISGFYRGEKYFKYL